ncbi:histidine phosphatase family protein [Anaerococcus sp.]|uniref:histidine phosphatase family protein n=2 Tax=Anaerococcus sp. TaxID=1872515 RepID=UPI002A760591|nr:histidine phosphatase family protein [Anaerococcus sp.]MDY2927736.1 histidine phosphatase family protein [Anaerococcus sp.]
MRKLYLVRHGQTLFNLRGKTQGWCDSPLTDLGIEQAKITRRFFEENNIRIDEVYSSTSERAIDTANIITDLPINPRKRLKEWNFGKMEGEPEDLQKVPRLPGQMTHGDFFVPFGGESDKQAYERFAKEIDDIISATLASNILVVAHGGVLWLYYLSKAEERKTEDSKYFGNCCILEFNIDDNNDVSFCRIYNPDIKL